MMAQVKIYPEHREVLDDLISSTRVASPLGAAATGPFKDQRDAYIFAASIGVALGEPAPEGEMLKNRRKDAITIRDSVLFGAAGGKELSLAVILLQDLEEAVDPEADVQQQLEQIADGDFSARLNLLDRYAYAGFAWLQRHRKDVGTTRDLVMEAIDQVMCTDVGPEDVLQGTDPLRRFLV